QRPCGKGKRIMKIVEWGPENKLAAGWSSLRQPTKWFMAIIVMILLGSCQKDEQVDLFIDSSLQEYFNRFAAEGAARNVMVDYTASRVSGYIRLITTPNVVGQCAHDATKPNTVIIDKIYWDSADDLEREFVVFHELGHCVLNREHLDEADAQGNCISIMTSGNGSCKINYTQATRSAYLDELFHP
ncbi:MAG TPA: hypothetical protein VJ508_08635, partial [Saprospiraceae bacterium]|nr:hypothetical protein [Saprospiraceae bacterium]